MGQTGTQPAPKTEGASTPGASPRGGVIAIPQRTVKKAKADQGKEAGPPPEPGTGEGGGTPGKDSQDPVNRPAVIEVMSPDTYLTTETQRTLIPPEGVRAHGAALGGVVSELALVLGEIVMDRATSRAFDLLKKKILEGLACSTLEPGMKPAGEQTPDAEKAAAEKAAKAQSKWPATCEVVVPLRLQDLAVTTSALQGAVLQDVMRMGLDKTKPDADKAKADATPKLTSEDHAFLSRLIQAGLLPYLTRSHRPLSNEEANALVQDLLAYFTAKAGETPCSKTEKNAKNDTAAVLVTAGAALTACIGTSIESNGDPANCSVMQLADQFARQCNYLTTVSDNRLALTHHARIIAQHLHAAATARVDGNTSGRPDVRVRMGHAVDAVVEMTCRFAARDAGCDGTPSQDDEMARAISLFRNASHAALDRDTNALIRAASVGISLVDPNQTGGARKGLRIIGGALQYAETYYQPATVRQEGSSRVQAVTDNDVVETAHASRRRILESLTEEMTDRTGRETDTIISLGGSLRATAGARFLSGEGRETEFEGPLSLPLGLGLQIPTAQDGGRGLHLEVGVLDLGRYVAIRDRTLEEFDAADALAPSLTFGYYWGQQFPVFIAASGLYQPLFTVAAEEAQEGRPARPESVGAWSLTFNVGVYVPLFDLN